MRTCTYTPFPSTALFRSLGDGVELAENGRVSFVNQPALDSGVKRGMPVRKAARLMLAYDAAERAAADVTNRTVMAQNAAGRHIVCTDSIAFALPEDIDNVLVTAGHTGRSAVPYLLKARPYGFICRSEEHTSELQSLMRISYAVFCLKKKKHT